MVASSLNIEGQEHQEAGAANWTWLQIFVVAICTLINALDGMDVLSRSVSYFPRAWRG